MPRGLADTDSPARHPQDMQQNCLTMYEHSSAVHTGVHTRALCRSRATIQLTNTRTCQSLALSLSVSAAATTNSCATHAARCHMIVLGSSMKRGRNNSTPTNTSSIATSLTTCGYKNGTNTSCHHTRRKQRVVIETGHGYKLIRAACLRTLHVASGASDLERQARAVA